MTTPIKFDRPISFEPIDKIVPSASYEGTRVYVREDYTDDSGKEWSKGWYECVEDSTGVYKWEYVELKDIHFEKTSIVDATRAQLFTDALSKGKGFVAYNDVKFASAEVPRYQTTGSVQSVYVNICSSNWGSMIAVSQTNQYVSFCQISGGVISDWKALSMDTLNDGVQEIESRQALYNLAYTTNHRLEWSFYGSFTTASENPNGVAAGASARFTFHMYIVNGGGFARMVAYDRSSADIYTCRGESLQGAGYTWGAWVKLGVQSYSRTILTPGVSFKTNNNSYTRSGNIVNVYLNGVFAATSSNISASTKILSGLPANAGNFNMPAVIKFQNGGTYCLRIDPSGNVYTDGEAILTADANGTKYYNGTVTYICS